MFHLALIQAIFQRPCLAGEVYSLAQGMFDNDMYSQLILVVDSAIKEAKINSNNFEADYVSISLHNYLFGNLPRSSFSFASMRSKQ